LLVAHEELKEFVRKEPCLELLKALETGRRELGRALEDVGEDIVTETRRAFKRNDKRADLWSKFFEKGS